jgi:hypothetical protein
VKGIRSEEEIGYIQKEELGSGKWSEVKGIRSEGEIGYFQEQEMENDKWSEVN